MKLYINFSELMYTHLGHSLHVMFQTSSENKKQLMWFLKNNFRNLIFCFAFFIQTRFL